MTAYISVKNWERFQHYKDRDPPWVKLYRDLLTGEAWVLGTDTSRLVQVASILIAARYSNQIPLKWSLILKVCCLDLTEQQLREAIETLAQHDFLEIHHDQEDSADASKQSIIMKHIDSNPLATCTSEAEAEQSREDQIREDPPTPQGGCKQSASKPLSVPQETHSAHGTEASAQGTDGWFLDFKLAYPERAGDPNWRGALRAAHARLLDGHTTDEFLAGARRYAEFVRAIGKTGTEFVQQASRFLGPGKPFLEPWNLPATKADARLSVNLAAAEEFLRRTEKIA